MINNSEFRRIQEAELDFYDWQPNESLASEAQDCVQVFRLVGRDLLVFDQISFLTQDISFMK